jgi:phospholipid-translocating ATPase
MITWIVVIGSILVMLLWIAIYSFFTSPQFNREVVILFSTIDFWATVFLAVALALGEPIPCTS